MRELLAHSRALVNIEGDTVTYNTGGGYRERALKFHPFYTHITTSGYHFGSSLWSGDLPRGHDSDRDEIIENLIENKLKRLFQATKENPWQYDICLSEKGNYIITVYQLRPYVPDEVFKENLNRGQKAFKNYVSYTKEQCKPERLRKPWLSKKVYTESIKRWKKEHNGLVTYLPAQISTEELQKTSIYLHKTQLIITKDGRVYLKIGKKLRRYKKFALFQKNSFVSDIFFYPFNHLNLYRSAENSDNLRCAEVILDIAEVIYPNFKLLREMIDKMHPDFTPREERRDYFASLMSYCNYKEESLEYILSTDFTLTIPKSIRKAIGQNVNYLVLYWELTNTLKFKDVNVIKRILESPYPDNFNKGAFWMQKLVLYYKELCKYYKGTNNNVESILANRLLRGDKGYVMSDALQMFATAIKLRRSSYGKSKGLEPFDYSYLKKDLTDLHEYLSKLSRRDEAKLNYREYDLSLSPYLEKEVNGYSILMPRNSDEVVRLSEIMHNCVASYAKRIDLDEIILYATNYQGMIDYIREGIGEAEKICNYLKTTENYPACIEIRRDRKREEKEHTEDIMRQELADICGNSTRYISCFAPAPSMAFTVIQNYSLHNNAVKSDSPLGQATSNYFAQINAEEYKYSGLIW